MKHSLKARALATVLVVAVGFTCVPAVMPALGATNMVTTDGQAVVTTEWWLDSEGIASTVGGIKIPTDLVAACGGGGAFGAAVKRGLNLKATSLVLYGLGGWLIYIAWQGTSSTRDKVTTGLTCATIAHELVKKPGSTEAAKTTTGGGGSSPPGGGGGKGVPKGG